MEKITMHEIAAQLAEQGFMSAKEADLFVSELFDVVQMGLERDGLVKVKGFGTFKIIDVEARESIDVNTGERIVIEGRGKITFTPEAAMKEAVNKPFSLFETVLLNEGVTFDDMNENLLATSSSLVPSKEDEDLAEEELVDEELVDEETTNVEEMPEPDVPEMSTESEESTNAVEPGMIATELEFAEIEPSVDKSVDSHPVDVAPIEVEQAEPEQTELNTSNEEGLAADKETIVEESVKCESAEEESADKNEGSNVVFDEEEEETSYKWLWIVALTVVVAAVGGYWFFGLHNGTTEELAEEPQSQVAVTNTDSFSQASDSLIGANSPSKELRDSSALESTQLSKRTGEAKGILATDSVNYERMDARVRTGAYRIVGLERTVKAKEGQVLKTLAERQLGPDMSCYVEVFNGMKGNTVLKAGQEVKIPRLELKKRKRPVAQPVVPAEAPAPAATEVTPVTEEGQAE